MAEAPPITHGALDLRDRLASGALSAEALTTACLSRIASREPQIQAWAYVDGEHAVAQAKKLDATRAAGRPIGPLHGLPVGVKDIIDTVRIPTENGAALDKGRVAARDAFVVERLKAAGAVILGKTVTTELAFMHPSRTRNPQNVEHTPGGSSSGSAAAVADGMVPLAVGTQTGGSVIRPASFCGVCGYKPSFGAIPRRGVLPQSPFLDTVGVFAADPLGAAILAEVLFGYDAADPATEPAPHPRLLDMAQSEPPLPPVFALVKPPAWADADPDLHGAFAELAEALGDQVFEVDLPPIFSDAAEIRKRINLAEMSRCYLRYRRDAFSALGPATRTALEQGERIVARDYIAALDWRRVLNDVLGEIFERCDAILCPAAPGPAPKGLQTTGDAIFNGLWTLCGTPAVTLPVLTASSGLPMGAQLVGPLHDDGRLLRTAAWLDRWVQRTETEGDH